MRIFFLTHQFFFTLKFSDFLKSELRTSPYCLLFGHPVGHSLSPVMHQTAAEHYGMNLNYVAVDVSPSDLQRVASVFNDDSFIGANITIPYKKEFIAYVDQPDERVTQIGATNTLHKNEHQIHGYNTDVDGFLAPLEAFEDDLHGESAVVFGTGGASKAVCYALLEVLQMEQVYVVSRTPDPTRLPLQDARVQIASYSNWAAFAGQASLIVNTTPVGMEPDTGKRLFPLAEAEVLHDKICYDLIYKPRETNFLSDALEVGAYATLDGLDMLIHQGSKAFEIWTGYPFPVSKIKERLEDELATGN